MLCDMEDSEKHATSFDITTKSMNLKIFDSMSQRKRVERTPTLQPPPHLNVPSHCLHNIGTMDPGQPGLEDLPLLTGCTDKMMT